MSVRIPYAYTDGSTFSPTDHNTNIYDVGTSGGEENGILSALNGGVVAADFNSGFEILRESVQPGEGIIVEGSMVTHSNDFYDDVFGDFESATFLKIPGRGLRIDLPWDGDVLWNIQCYISTDHFSQAIDAVEKRPDLLLRPTIDGSAVTALTRGVPVTTMLDASSTPFETYEGLYSTSGVPTSNATEARRASRYAMSWLSQGLSAGPHEIALTLYMEKVATVNKILVSYFANGDTSVNSPIEAHCRVTFGISHVTALPMFVGQFALLDLEIPPGQAALDEVLKCPFFQRQQLHKQQVQELMR